MVNPIAFAILIIIVVFLPLFSLTGLEGKLFKPMALTITFAMAGSLLLSMTLVPVLAALILKPKEEKDTFLVRWAKQLAYLPLLDWALERKKLVIGSAVALLVGSRSRCFRFLARSSCRRCRKARSSSASTAFRRRRSTSRSASSNVVSAELHKQFPQVRSVLATIGRAERRRDDRRELHGDQPRPEAAVGVADPRRSPTPSSARRCRR